MATERAMTDAEIVAVAKLDALRDGDQEAAHGEADGILLKAAHPDVRAAYSRAAVRTGPWWYA